MSGLLLALGVLALLLALLLKEALQIVFAKVPDEVQQRWIGAAEAPAPSRIPRVLWTYWEPQPAPAFVRQCLDNWRRFAPDHELRLLDRQSLHRWIEPGALALGFDQLPPFRQADWLRVQLLARHGGIWMDASTLLTRDLGWVHELQARARAEYVGFYIDRYTTRPELPLVENWFMAALPASPFVLALAEAFDAALAIGAEANLERLRAEGRLAQVVQDLTPDFQRYLLMHVAAADVLDREPEAYRLALLRAEDSALGFHAALGWRKRHLYARLALTRCPSALPVLIKLRGGDRRVVEQGLLKKRWRRNSALDRLLQLPL